MRFPATTLSLSAGAIAAAAIGFVLLGASGHGAQNARPAASTTQAAGMPVPVVAVIKRTVPVYLDYVGTTEAIRSIALQARVTGYLGESGSADGADVSPGELLYRIDPRDYQAALDQAKAQAQHDAAAYDYSRVSQRRNATLATDGWVARDTFDQTTSTLRQSEATLAADAAAIQTATLNLGYTEIRAPFAGRLGRSLVHEGALISAAGTELNTLVQLDPIYATFNPSETDLAAIDKYRSKGAIQVDVLSSDNAGGRFVGTLSFLDNVVDRTTGTIIARATISNPDRSLLPGEFVHVRVHITDRADALLVPQAAVGSSQLGKFLYVVGQGDKVEQRFVSLGETYGSLIVVERGLRASDTIIIGDLQKLAPGALVQPQPMSQSAT